MLDPSAKIGGDHKIFTKWSRSAHSQASSCLGRAKEEIKIS